MMACHPTPDWFLRTAPVLFGVCLATAALQDRAKPIPQDQRPAFRLGVDLLTLEVQVTERDGRPVKGLTPDRFEVFVDGRRRQVVHAELTDINLDSGPGGISRAPLVGRGSATAGEASRLYVLAVDEYSLRSDVLMSARSDMERFVSRLHAQDFVGVYAFPNGQLIVAPTRDHTAVRAAIGRLTGHYERLPSKYNLIESEIVGLTERDPDITSRVVERECARGRACDDLLAEARALAGQLEAIGAARLRALDALFEGLAASPRLKTVVLVSGHLATGSSAIGRPNLQTLTKAVGQRAAEANIALYIVYFDSTMMDMRSARERTPREVPSWEAAIHGAGLEYVRAASKGHMSKVQAGTSDYVFDRVLRETAAHYLLGVTTHPEDRDGGRHGIQVSVRQRGTVVRHPTIAIIPK